MRTNAPWVRDTTRSGLGTRATTPRVGRQSAANPGLGYAAPLGLTGLEACAHPGGVLAHAYMGRERRRHTLQTTALINEA